MKHIVLTIFILLSVDTLACKCVPGDTDKWFSESSEVVHVKIIGTSAKIPPDNHEEVVEIHYKVIERFKGKLNQDVYGNVTEELNNCALGILSARNYVLYIYEDRRSISRCGGSSIIYPYTQKGKNILEKLRAK